MSIMVTGGTGFVGARITRRLVEQGHEVVCFDQFPPRGNLRSYLDRIKVYRGDVTQMAQLMEAVQTHGVRRIIHMAAVLAPDSEERPHHAMHANIHGTNNVFEVARWTGIERVVYASSIAYYGLQEPYGERPVTEDDVSHPISVYGMTKVANEFAAQHYARRFGLDICGIRICSVFGHGRALGITGLIGGGLISLPAVGKPVELPIDPEVAMPLIYVEDAAEIFVRAALSDSLKSPVYISGGHLATLGELADLVRGLIPDARITLGEGSIPHIYLVDSSRMLRDIGYELPPLRGRVLDHINEAREEAGLRPIKDAGQAPSRGSGRTTA